MGDLLELAEKDTTLPSAAKAAVKVLSHTLEGLENALNDLRGEISDAHARSETSRLLAEAPGIGKLFATAVVAHVPDPTIFKSVRDFAAWIGLAPRQNSSGGKQTLGSISKQGNRYLRKLLVLASAGDPPALPGRQ